MTALKTNRLVLSLLVLVGIGQAMGQADGLGAIRVRRSVVVASRTVLLGDVANLTGYAAADLASIQVAQIGEGDDSVKVRLVALRPILAKHGVNWGRLSLGGFSHCTVRYVEPIPTGEIGDNEADIAQRVSESARASGVVLANPIQEVSVDAVATVRDRTLDFLTQLTGWRADQIQVRFAARDAAVLSRLVGLDRLEFEPLGTVGVGRLPITIRRFSDGQLVGTDRVTAQVEQHLLGVVVTRTMTRGQSFAPGDIEVREVVIDRSGIEPLTDLNLVIGQTAARFIRQGTILETQDVRPPVMVRRGELITVRCLTNGLMIKTVARASEQGVLGQIIRVRNEQSRDQYTVRVTAPRQATTDVNVDDTTSPAASAGRMVSSSSEREDTP